MSHCLVTCLLMVGPLGVLGATNPFGPPAFRADVEPILSEYCYDCHADGMDKGGVSFDEFDPDDDPAGSRELWLRALKNLRAETMPPIRKPQPTDAERSIIVQWIKAGPLEIDPENPDPGRVTLRRLNRVEYRNTVRDLMGVDFDTENVFPPDDTGHGFDNIGDVLTLPPMLLEKYLMAAKTIVAEAVPATRGVEAASSRRFLTQAVPETVEGRRHYAGEFLESFANRAFRRPVNAETVDRLTDLAEQIYTQPDQSFEAGIRQAMVAVLVSPRFLFREEHGQTVEENEDYSLIDEYALASRLSYFLWSSMPDEELFRLAEAGQLRSDLSSQVSRMIADRRSDEFTRNFVGQWLRARDIETVQIEDRVVLAREEASDPEFEARLDRFRQLRRRPAQELSEEEQRELAELRPPVQRWFRRPLRANLDDPLRRAMRRETEMHFDYVMDEDRSLLELLNSDYTFLNERLARHYGIDGVEGDAMRRVNLSADSPRGGLLTQGTVLAVTSNPTRTSPVKRGWFILDNVLGAAPPPPPPDIPALEDAATDDASQSLTLRETLAIHRRDPLCSSCHNRMDPLGLAMENFNAMGMWRDRELDEPIDSTGKLITGEEFSTIVELKSILVSNHSQEFYRTVTEKLLTYALGRGLEYYDVEAVDQIVSRIENHNGRSSALLMGIIESAPFQKTRPPEQAKTTGRIPAGRRSTQERIPS